MANSLEEALMLVKDLKHSDMLRQLRQIDREKLLTKKAKRDKVLSNAQLKSMLEDSDNEPFSVDADSPLQEMSPIQLELFSLLTTTRVIRKRRFPLVRRYFERLFAAGQLLPLLHRSGQASDYMSRLSVPEVNELLSRNAAYDMRIAQVRHGIQSDDDPSYEPTCLRNGSRRDCEGDCRCRETFLYGPSAVQYLTIQHIARLYGVHPTSSSSPFAVDTKKENDRWDCIRRGREYDNYIAELERKLLPRGECRDE